MQAFEVRCEKEGRVRDQRKGVWGFQDGVAELTQDSAVERGENRVLEDCGADGVGFG